ncbi:MAG TPA: hypothetical protein VFA68_16175 [Terriglobales bacterium]|nr:hypothetical protein [Terriglobales bacterium]
MRHTCVFVLAVSLTIAFVTGVCQSQFGPCGGEASNSVVQCPTSDIPLPYGTFSSTPLMDGTQAPWGNYGDVISLYGAYGNIEKTSSAPAYNHYKYGTDLAPGIVPLCTDGSQPQPGQNCSNNNQPPAILFLFLGFSNWDIEIGGGAYDIWEQGYPFPDPQPGQPCATTCPNLNNPGGGAPWNQPGPPDTIVENSFLRMIYPSRGVLNGVGPHVVVFNGALGNQLLSAWDVTAQYGYYRHNACPFLPGGPKDPECNYKRVAIALANNGFSELQVQAVFFKSADGFPQCDLRGMYCAIGVSEPDAYTSERYLGDIVRYLKCCTLDANGNSTGIKRYPNLKQAFLTSRTYGGYAKNPLASPPPSPPPGCLNPEPYAFEEGIAVQRLITAQIRQTNGIQTPVDSYAGPLDYSMAPWVDWGPYLWTDGFNGRSDGVVWCGGQSDPKCNEHYDVRWGDLLKPTIYWGDYTHPSAYGQAKVANLLFQFITGTFPTGHPQQTISDWVMPWIGD